jgi:hypothetical protein
MVTSGHKVIKEIQDLRVIMEIRDHKVTLVLKVIKEIQDLRVIMEIRDHKVQ